GRDITFQVYSALRKKGGDDDARRHFPRDMLPMLEHQQHVKEVDEQFERQEQFEKKYNDEIARISEQIHQIQRRIGARQRSDSPRAAEEIAELRQRQAELQTEMVRIQRERNAASSNGSRRRSGRGATIFGCASAGGTIAGATTPEGTRRSGGGG